MTTLQIILSIIGLVSAYVFIKNWNAPDVWGGEFVNQSKLFALIISGISLFVLAVFVLYKLV